MQRPEVELCPIDGLKPYANNARTHSARQIEQIARSIERFGFTNPVLIGDDGGIIAGHGRVTAARKLGWREVPVIRLAHLSEAERRAYVLADNKLAENAGWDSELLAIELQGLAEIDFDLELTGFSTTEIDLVLDGAPESGTVSTDERLDPVPEIAVGPAVCQRGDVWLLGKHRLLCGDAGDVDAIRRLCTGPDGLPETVSLLFTDPPYNVPIDGHVSGLGRVRHREFAEASGEMDREAFTAFLRKTLGSAASVLSDGAIAFVCMDWRHMRELLDAGHSVFDELKNLCVWNKSNAGMGAFYRSKHELVFVFKKGRAAHINNFGLGDGGRYRTNVWNYAGMNSFGTSRDSDLAMHPTIKPVAMIADAIRDCSRRGDVVLVCFGGSGSTLIAADSCGRRARLIELDPLYCDTIIRRWQTVVGEKAIHQTSRRAFDEPRREVGDANTNTPQDATAGSRAVRKPRVARQSQGEPT